MSNVPKNIKVLSGFTAKQEAQTKKGLTVSGSIQPDCNISLDVEKDTRLNGDVYVSGYSHAEGFSQVGALGVLGFLDINGHVKVAETLRISGSSDFVSISETRDEENTYLVDNVIQALDERVHTFRTAYNENKIKLDSGPTLSGIQEHNSNFPWSYSGYVSIDIMVYDPVEDSWSNDLISVKMVKNASNNTIKFIVTTPLVGEAHPDTVIRVIATKQTDII